MPSPAFAFAEKSPEAFRSISEAAGDLDLPQHVLRFWESRFSQLKPLKRAGGRRYYRPEDIDLLRGIRALLYNDGLTIKGVQRLHREQGLKKLASWGDPDGTVAFEPEGIEPSLTPAPETARAEVPTVKLRQALAALEGARARLEAVLSRTA